MWKAVPLNDWKGRARNEILETLEWFRNHRLHPLCGTYMHPQLTLSHWFVHRHLVMSHSFYLMFRGDEACQSRIRYALILSLHIYIVTGSLVTHVSLLFLHTPCCILTFPTSKSPYFTSRQTPITHQFLIDIQLTFFLRTIKSKMIYFCKRIKFLSHSLAFLTFGCIIEWTFII